MTAADPAHPDAARDPRQPRERLGALFDAGTLREITPADASGAQAGSGQIDGMPAVAFASDPGVQGGAMGTLGCAAIVAAYDEAIALGAPVIGLWHSGGARLREGVESLHAVGTVFAAMTRASGVVPQISVVLGPAAGGAAYGPALTDVVILSEAGRIFVTGPDVVRSVTGEDVTQPGTAAPSRIAAALAWCTWSRRPTRKHSPRQGGWPCCSATRAPWCRLRRAPRTPADPIWPPCCPTRRAAHTTFTRS